MANQVILLCDNFRRELESLELKKRFGDVEFLFFKGNCGLAPLDWKELQDMIPAEYEKLHVLTGGCIRSIPEEYLSSTRWKNCHISHCLNLIITPELTTYFSEKGFYLVSPGWLNNWQGYLKQQGFDQKTAREFYGEVAEKILLLDTGLYQEAQGSLVLFADYIGLPAESISLGLDYFELLLNNLIMKGRLDYSERLHAKNLVENRKELADFTMALDLLNSLTSIRDDDTVLIQIKEMFTMLFAPEEVLFRLDCPHGADEALKINARHDCISIAMQGSEGLLGYLDLKGLQLPQYKKQYEKIAGKIINICGMAIENARHYKMIKELSYTDGLTGLANRFSLEECLGNEWRRMMREKQPLTVVMGDIDFFKAFNDYYGHQVGDDCLKKVAGVLKEKCRRPGDLAARYGGEEFILVLPNTDQEGALEMVELIRQEVEALKMEHKKSPVSDYVTASFGVATVIPGPEYNLRALITEADRLLYEAKEAGRNRVSNK